MYQHFFFITNLRYFVDHDLNFYNNKVSSRKELFQLSQNSVRKQKTNYFTSRHPAGFSGNRLRKNKQKEVHSSHKLS